MKHIENERIMKIKEALAHYKPLPTSDHANKCPRCYRDPELIRVGIGFCYVCPHCDKRAKGKFKICRRCLSHSIERAAYLWNNRKF